MSVCKNVLKKFQMSEQYWGCSDKMSEANFSPAETLFCTCNEKMQHMFLIAAVLFISNRITTDKLSQ